MSRRIDIELTSSREDGSWTWRAAGAREPRGTLESAILPGGAAVGEVLRVEIEGYLDALSVIAVLPPRGPPAPSLNASSIKPSSTEQPLGDARPLGPASARGERGRRNDRGSRPRPPGEGRDGREGEAATPRSRPP